MENRFENGDYNLATNYLTYGGLVSATHLVKELGKSEAANLYQNRAAELRKAIEKYFGATVQGFNIFPVKMKNKTLYFLLLMLFLPTILFAQKYDEDAEMFGDYKNTADRPAEFFPVEGDWEAIPTTNESCGYHHNLFCVSSTLLVAYLACVNGATIGFAMPFKS